MFISNPSRVYLYVTSIELGNQNGGQHTIGENNYEYFHWNFKLKTII